MNTTALMLALLSVLHSAMSTAVKVKAPRGGNASIPCPYHRGSELYPKYFSKGRDRTELVRVNSHSTSSVKGRYSLEDDRDTREFTLTIRNLSVEDAGLYWCGVDIWGSDELTEVNLDVVEDILPSIDNSDTQKPPTQTESATYKTPTSSSGQSTISTSITGERMVLGGCLAGALLLCGILSGMFIKVKLNRPGRRAGTPPASCHSGQAEEDYVRMNPCVTPVDSSSTGPHSHLPTGAAQPPPEHSNVYEHLRVDSKQDSVYHTLAVTSR